MCFVFVVSSVRLTSHLSMVGCGGQWEQRVRDGGAVDGCQWVSRQDGQWLGLASWRCSVGGLGVPFTLAKMG